MNTIISLWRRLRAAWKRLWRHDYADAQDQLDAMMNSRMPAYYEPETTYSRTTGGQVPNPLSQMTDKELYDALPPVPPCPNCSHEHRWSACICGCPTERISANDWPDTIE